MTLARDGPRAARRRYRDSGGAAFLPLVAVPLLGESISLLGALGIAVGVALIAL